MKKNIGKRLLCCLLAALFILCCVPLRSEADGQYGTITFSTMEELRGFCDEAKNFSGKSPIMPNGKTGAPCGACREFMAQLMIGKYESVEIMLDYEHEKVVTLAELTPDWWL